MALEQIGNRAQAIARAEAALRIYEAIEDPNAAQVRAALTAWRKAGTGRKKALAVRLPGDAATISCWSSNLCNLGNVLAVYKAGLGTPVPRRLRGGMEWVASVAARWG